LQKVRAHIALRAAGRLSRILIISNYYGCKEEGEEEGRQEEDCEEEAQISFISETPRKGRFAFPARFFQGLTVE
jgi:hypothetical protein